MKTIRALGIAALIVTAGCDSDGIERPPPTTVHVFNAASNIASVAVLREEILLIETNYAGGTQQTFDSGPYDFHLQTLPVGSFLSERVLTFREDLGPRRDNLFVILARDGEPEVFVSSTEEFSADTGTARWTLFHAFDGLGDLDVYVEPADTDLTQAVPRGRIAFATPLTFEFAIALPRLYLTAPGDPTSIIFESLGQDVLPNTSEVLVISDPGNQGSYDILVSRVRANTGRLAQEGQQSAVRMINLTEDRTARDVYLDDTTEPPLLAAFAYGELTPYLVVEPTQHSIISTPVDNPGTVEGQVGWFATPGRVFTVFLTGDASTGITHNIVAEDNRSLDGEVSLQIISGATLFAQHEVFIVDPGTDITTVNATVTLQPPAFTQRLRLLPGDYELFVRDDLTDAVIAGPEPLSMGDGGVYSLILSNSLDGSTVDAELIEDFVP